MIKIKKITALFLVFILAMLCACSDEAVKEPENGGFNTVTDLMGRSVAVPNSINRVVCIGAGALRLYSYIGDMSKLAAVESCEYGFLISERPYQIVNEELFKSLPSAGTGGPQGTPDAEALIQAAPDVIFSLYTADVKAADELQKATDIPVVVLSYGKTEAFDADITKSIELMGQILGREQRAGEVNAFIEKIKSDLNDRTKAVPDAEKKTVYLGCQSKFGTHGIGSSTADYSLFDAVNAKNILDINGYSGYQGNIDMETLIKLNPEIIILDAGGLSNLKEEYNENREAFSALRAFASGEVYLQLPYNAYYTNLETAFADAYFIGSVLFPEQFSDVKPDEKFSEICSFLLSGDCYETLAEKYGGYRKFDISSLAN